MPDPPLRKVPGVHKFLAYGREGGQSAGSCQQSRQNHQTLPKPNTSRKYSSCIMLRFDRIDHVGRGASLQVLWSLHPKVLAALWGVISKRPSVKASMQAHAGDSEGMKRDSAGMVSTIRDSIQILSLQEAELMFISSRSPGLQEMKREQERGRQYCPSAAVQERLTCPTGPSPSQLSANHRQPRPSDHARTPCPLQPLPSRARFSAWSACEGRPRHAHNARRSACIRLTRSSSS